MPPLKLSHCYLVTGDLLVFPAAAPALAERLTQLVGRGFMALARRPGEPCAVGYDRAMTSGGGRGRQSSGKPLQQLLNAIVPGDRSGRVPNANNRSDR